MPTLTEQERLEQLLMYCGDNKSEFGRRLGISPQTAYSIIKRCSYDAVALSKAFPEVSYEWLIRGTGQMFDYDKENDEQMALDILGITSDELQAFRDWQSQSVQTPQTSQSVQTPSPYQSVETPSPSQSVETPVYNQECTHAYARATSLPLQVADGDPVDRALLNLLLREKSSLEAKLAAKDQELEVLRTRNLQLEKENAVMSDRLQNAETWYRTNIQKK